MKKIPQNKINQQIEFPFPEKTFEEERDEIARKYKIADKTQLQKKGDGKWYMDNQTVEDWDAAWRMLEDKQDLKWWQK